MTETTPQVGVINNFLVSEFANMESINKMGWLLFINIMQIDEK